MRLAVLHNHGMASLYLKVQVLSRPVIAVAQLLVLGQIGFLSPVTPFVFPSLCSSEGRGGGYVQRLILLVTDLHSNYCFNIGFLGAGP